MAQERLSPEGMQPPDAWPSAYEQSPWLDVHNAEIQVEGDPETEEEFAATYEFLQLVTVYFQTEHGSIIANETKGLWWTVTAQDIEDELEHRNAWATWEALQRRQRDETVTSPAVTLANALAVSYRRLQALQEVGGPQQPEYPLFLHLHEQIRAARLKEAHLAQVLPVSAHEPLPSLSPFLTTPVWKLLEQTQRRYNPDTYTNTVLYGDPAHARYGFETIDPFQPHRPETEFEREMHYFPNQEQAVAVYHEYMDMGYLVGDVDDYQENITLVEPWEPQAQEDEGTMYTEEDGAGTTPF